MPTVTNRRYVRPAGHRARALPAIFALVLLTGCSLPALPTAPLTVLPGTAAPVLPPAASATPAAPLPATDTVAVPTPATPPATSPPTPPAAPTVAPTSPPAPTSTTASGGPPVPNHVVVVMEENHGYGEIIGAPAAPYINALAGQGALFTNSHAVTHPSEPNYLALFSGGTQGVGDDSCPHQFGTPNLGSALRASGRSFAGYSEDLPAEGSTVCAAGGYARKHNPWVNFTNLPASTNRPLISFPADYSTLPTLAFVIPNQDNDMHNGTVSQADSWLQAHLDGFVRWAAGHNSLLIVQWDEDDNSNANRIPTIFAGPMIRSGAYGEAIDHYTVLRTVEDFYGLPRIGHSADATPITDVWQPGGSH